MQEDLKLDALLGYANEMGLLVNNLFQLDDGSWRANLRTPEPISDKGEFFFEFGNGDTPQAAMFNALQRAVDSGKVEAV